MPFFSRRQFLSQAAAAPLLTALPKLYAQSAVARRPNILIVLADDQGWGDLSVHGNTNLSTLNIDSLARDGALFEHFYVCAVCAPTRAEFLTGRYHSRGGVRGVSTGAERLNLDEWTIAQTFQSAGYATAAFGKWHNGSQSPYHPNARGFDEFYGFTSGHWGLYFNPELDHNGELVRGKGYIADDLTSHAISFIDEHLNQPFFCYLALNTPHSPMQVPDKYFDKFANLQPKLRATDPALENVSMTRAALAMCENIDWNVGRVLKAIDDRKLSSNTVVLYFSDNGPNSWRWNGGMKGRKGSVDEGGVRAPLLMRWPGHIQPKTRVAQIAGAIDLLPTLADLAGISTASPKALDGKSLKPLLTGAKEDWPERMIFSLQGKQVSVRTQRYRIDPKGAVFDMESDPGQIRNIAPDHPAVANKLRSAVADWSKEMLPLVGPDDRPFPVGHAKLTLLPARDGVGSGAILRSAIAPNCSYFTHWTGIGDRMTWDIEIEKAGEFQVSIYYTCQERDAGSTIEVSFGEARIEGRVGPAWDPPQIGREYDRVDRDQESYWKEFHPLQLGSLYLSATRGKLTLRALEVAGKQVADVRRIALRRF